MSKSDTGEWLKEVVELSLLYDFYGELLTESSKRLFEGYVLEDMSLSELSEETGISRQGIHDSVKRSVDKLRKYEDKLGLVRKFSDMKDEVKKIHENASRLSEKMKSDETARRLLDEILKTGDKMLEEF